MTRAPYKGGSDQKLAVINGTVLPSTRCCARISGVLQTLVTPQQKNCG